jgi:hypothetical protein
MPKLGSDLLRTPYIRTSDDSFCTHSGERGLRATKDVM